MRAQRLPGSRRRRALTPIVRPPLRAFPCGSLQCSGSWPGFACPVQVQQLVVQNRLCSPCAAWAGCTLQVGQDLVSPIVDLAHDPLHPGGLDPGQSPACLRALRLRRDDRLNVLHLACQFNVMHKVHAVELVDQVAQLGGNRSPDDATVLLDAFQNVLSHIFDQLVDLFDNARVELADQALLALPRV